MLLMLLFILCILDNVVATKDWRHFGTDDGTKTDEFSEKFQREGGGAGSGGGHFQSKILCCRLWNLKQDFLSMELIQKSHFSVQGMGWLCSQFIENLCLTSTVDAQVVIAV